MVLVGRRLKTNPVAGAPVAGGLIDFGMLGGRWAPFRAEDLGLGV